MKAVFLVLVASIAGAFAQTCPLYAVTVTPSPVTLTITANATTVTAPTPTKYVTVSCPAPGCKPQTCGNFVTRCNPKLDCWCGLNAEGSGFCFQNAWCNELKQCKTTKDCPQGTQCAVQTCCGVGVCASLNCTSAGPVKKKRQAVAQQDSMAYKAGMVIPPFDSTRD